MNMMVVSLISSASLIGLEIYRQSLFIYHPLLRLKDGERRALRTLLSVDLGATTSMAPVELEVTITKPTADTKCVR